VGSPASTPTERVLEQQGRSIAWLARKAGVSVSYAFRMLRGERPITDAFRASAAEALGVPEDILFPAETEQAAS
jgi:transcriptional regulator with XRE-family HTH domain